METGEIALSPNPGTADPCRRGLHVDNERCDDCETASQASVLSCCHSGRGEIKAEGVVGIARAFIGAGARSVLVSLWAIDDEGTLEFMKKILPQPCYRTKCERVP